MSTSTQSPEARAIVTRRAGVLHVETPTAAGWQSVATFPDTPQGKEDAKEAARRIAEPSHP